MLSCEDLDYIEIACMFRYPVTLTLISNVKVSGLAIDIQLNEHREECLKLDYEGKVQLVVLSHLVKLHVNIENPHFKEVVF